MTGGTSFSGAGGTGTAVIDITSQAPSTLYVLGSETLDNAIINLGEAFNDGGSAIVNQDKTGTGATLTLGSNLTINQTQSYADINSSDLPGDAIINDGIINVGFDDFSPDGFGQSVSGKFLVDATHFINHGTITVSNQGLLDLTGTVAASLINSVTAATGGLITIGGTVDGGTIITPADGIGGAAGTLDGVTLEGTLNLSADGSALTLTGGTSFSGAGGTGPAVIDITSEAPSTLTVLGSETLDNAVINIGEGYNDGGNAIVNRDTAGTGATLTLGADLTINQTQTYADLTSSNQPGDAIVNQGSINATDTGGGFVIDAPRFTNNAQISLANETLVDEAGSFINTGTITLGIAADFAVTAGDRFTNTGLIHALANAGTVTLTAAADTSLTGTTLTQGTLQVDAGTTLDAGLGNTITTLGGTIILNGPASALEQFDASTGSYDQAIDATLTTIQTGGVLDLRAGSSWSGANAVTDAGALQLQGGVFTAPTLDITGGLTGYGTIAAAVDNVDAITATGGTLTITGALTGNGLVTIDPGAALDLQSTGSDAVTYGGAAAKLILGDPAGYTGTLTNVAVSDTLSLLGVTATSATSSGTTLTVDLQGGTSLTYALGAASPTLREGVTLNGNGDTDLVFYREAAPSLTPTNVDFGKVQAGTSVSAFATLTNTAPADGFSEKLDAQISATGSLVATGSIALLAAGQSNSTTLQITEPTSVGGVKTGTATVALRTDGTGVDGLGPVVLPSETITTSGTVYNYATASVSPQGTVSLGNTHVGAFDSQTLTIANTAAAGAYSEALDASFASALGQFANTGSASGIAAGADSTALSVRIRTVAAGSFSGSETLALTSDGSTIDGLGTTALASDVFTVAGQVFNYATGALAATVTLGNHHVGDAVTTGLKLSNTAASGGFSELLDAGFVAVSGALTGAGTVSGLAAGASSTALGVTLATGTAGAIGGTVTVGLTSDGGTLDGLGLTTLANQTVAVSGNVFNYATASVAPSPVLLGNHHVGDVVTAAVTLANTAAPGAFSELLDAGFVAASGGVSDAGVVSGLAAGASSTALGVTLATGTAGAINGAVTLGLTSDGGTIDGLGLTTLTADTLAVSGDIYNYATAAGVAQGVAFGAHHVGDAVTQAITLANAAVPGAYSELLDAGFIDTTGGLSRGGHRVRPVRRPVQHGFDADAGHGGGRGHRRGEHGGADLGRRHDRWAGHHRLGRRSDRHQRHAV